LRASDETRISSGIAAIVRSPNIPDEAGALSYFTHEVDGRLRVGWWRRLKGRRIEVFTRSRVQIEFLESDSPEATARRVLEELTRADERVGIQSAL
jgi:hypothetical protein